MDHLINLRKILTRHDIIDLLYNPKAFHDRFYDSEVIIVDDRVFDIRGFPDDQNLLLPEIR